MGGVDDARRPRGGDRAGGHRPTRRRDRVPRSVHAREAGGHRGRDLRRAARPRARRGLEPRGVRRARRALRPPDQRDSRKRSRSCGPCSATATSTSRASSSPPARRSCCRGRLVPVGRRSSSGRPDRGCWRPRRRTCTRGTPGMRTRATRPAGVARLRALVDAAAAAAGRDPSSIERTVAVQVRMPGGTGRVMGDTDPKQVVTPLEGPADVIAERAARLRARGDRPRPAGGGPDHGGVGRRAGPGAGAHRPGLTPGSTANASRHGEGARFAGCVVLASAPTLHVGQGPGQVRRMGGARQ